MVEPARLGLIYVHISTKTDRAYSSGFSFVHFGLLSRLTETILDFPNVIAARVLCFDWWCAGIARLWSW